MLCKGPYDGHTSKLKALHVITGLNHGGAKTMLGSLLSRTQRERFEAAVISRTDIGPVGARSHRLLRRNGTIVARHEALYERICKRTRLEP